MKIFGLGVLGLLAPFAFPLCVIAAPSFDQVDAGSATVNQAGNTTTINQSTNKAVLNWHRFDVNQNETVNFQQPGVSSVTLNRIGGNTASSIHGQINANGQIFLMNPNGIIFGSSSRVNVGALFATSHQISNDNFMNGNYRFYRNGPGSVINRGVIHAASGGYVGLLGDTVINSGSITANLGQIQLLSGNAVVLDFHGDGLMHFALEGKTAHGFIQNTGTLTANGGRVVMSAKTSSDVFSKVVNNSGTIHANGIEGLPAGEIMLTADEGIVEQSGQILATSETAEGGVVKILGDQVALANNSLTDVSGATGGGTVLVGGDYQGQGDTPVATNTTVSEDSTIKANATQKGDGGKAIVYASIKTEFHGTIEAKAGPEGGNGGFVETSGKKTLVADGSVNASAPKGKAGEYLLDPRDVTLARTANSTADASVASIEAIESALNSGTNVTVTTGSDGSQAGNITVAGDINKTSGAAATLTLNAANNVTLNKGRTIKSTSGALNVALNADSDSNGKGAVVVQGSNATQLKLNNGTLSTQGVNAIPQARTETRQLAQASQHSLHHSAPTLSQKAVLEPSQTGIPQQLTAEEDKDGNIYIMAAGDSDTGHS